MRTLVYLGPSVERAAAEQVLAADYQAPIRRGDLPRAVEQGYRRVAIIDGEFGQSLAVSIIEIRTALARGLEVWGASSMGALRGAECHVLGMRCAGWIARRYVDGTLEADDEVALLFEPETGRALTVPLVNVRWSLDLAIGAGVLPHEAARPVLELARKLRFEERTYRALMLRAESTQVRHHVEALAAFVRKDPESCDRKRLDALELLRTLRDAPELGAASC